jgi:hypothetical protein
MSKFHQLSGGKSGSGCGKAPPRTEFMAQAGTISVTKNASKVRRAMIEGIRLVKKRKYRLVMSPPEFKSKLGDDGAIAMPAKKRSKLA